MIVPVTHGNAQISKTERDEKNLETQVSILETHGIREEHIPRDGRYELMSQVRLKKIAGDWLSRI